jgi:hypothetical protein
MGPLRGIEDRLTHTNPTSHDQLSKNRAPPPDRFGGGANPGPLPCGRCVPGRAGVCPREGRAPCRQRPRGACPCPMRTRHDPRRDVADWRSWSRRGRKGHENKGLRRAGVSAKGWRTGGLASPEAQSRNSLGAGNPLAAARRSGKLPLSRLLTPLESLPP